MSKVKILPKSIYSKIQAGEVIEGPYSVVKELIDNSYDANAEKIEVIYKKGGIEYISVKDNGEGIDKDDLQIVFKNHATSKINNEKDLYNINTMGFRGEALFSISSISRLTIKSKTEYQTEGYQIIVEANKLMNFIPIAMNTGTEVIVEDLFFNLPVRRKNLSSIKTESSKINRIFINKSFGFFDCEMILKKDSKIIYHLPKVEKFYNRVIEILGEKTVKSLHYVNLNDIKSKFNNFIYNFSINEFDLFFSSRDFTSKYRNYFITIFNKRNSIFPALFLSIKNFYNSYLPRGFFPYFILNINMSPSSYDLNIDPKKENIKIFNSKFFISNLIKILEYFLTKNLYVYNNTPDNNFSSTNSSINVKETDNTDFFPENKNSSIITQQNSKENKNSNELFSKNNKTDFFANTQKIITHNPETFIYNTKSEKIIGFFGEFKAIVFKTYILYENPNHLVFVDFHAAYERLNYNKLKYKEEKIAIRKLLFPEIIEFNPLKIMNIETFLKTLRESKIDVELITENAIQILGIPDLIPPEKESLLFEDIKGIFEEIDETLNKNKINLSYLYEKFLATLACRSSPKANDNLSLFDIKTFTEEFNDKIENYERCPHGRPTFIILPKDFFDKKFMRKK